VTTAHETSDAFNEEVLRENTIFQYAKETEMKQLLSSLADGQIEMYQAVRLMIFTFFKSETWLIQSRRRWKNGIVSFLLSNVFESMFNMYP